MRTASDHDLYLFGQGTNYQSYRLLGAHIGNEGVTFRVWAPNADQVAVIGDFNSWDGRINRMRSLGNSGVW
jgi:1,4-alpha-glucan branching enzyme